MKKVLFLALFLAFASLSYCQVSLHPIGTELHVVLETQTLLNTRTFDVISTKEIKKDFYINLQQYVDFDWDYIKSEYRTDLTDVNRVVSYERQKDGENQLLDVMVGKSNIVKGFILSNPKRGVIQVYLVDLVKFTF